MSGDQSYFATLYAGLLGQDNWILVESGRTIEKIRETPGRITIRKNDGRALIDGYTGSPVEISFCALTELLAQNLIKLVGKEGDQRHIYRPMPV